LCTLNPGHYFGEISCMTKMSHTASVRVKHSKGDGMLMVAMMTKENFNKLKENSPMIYLRFEKQMATYNDTEF